jgi:hypothetical protein
MLQEPVGRTFLVGELARPYGRGSTCSSRRPTSVPSMSGRAHGVEPWLAIEEAWCRRGDLLLGQRQLMVQDPGGYLLRLFEAIGTRPTESR